MAKVIERKEIVLSLSEKEAKAFRQLIAEGKYRNGDSFKEVLEPIEEALESIVGYDDIF